MQAMQPQSLPGEVWEAVGAHLSFTDFVSLKLASKAMLALPLPRIIPACKPLGLAALDNLTQQCSRTEALHVDISCAGFNSLAPRDLQGLTEQWMRQPALPLEQLWVSGDAPAMASANHLWLFVLLWRLPHVSVFVLSTKAFILLPAMHSICHLVLDLREQTMQGPAGQEGSVLGTMPCLQSLKVAFLEKGSEEDKPARNFCWWLPFDLSSCKQLSRLVFEHAVPRNWDWAVPPSCLISIEGSPAMLAYPEDPEDAEEDAEELPKLIQLVQQQLTCLHLTCNTVTGNNYAHMDTLDAIMVLYSHIPRGGVYSRLRVLKITAEDMGSREHPFALGDMFDALEVLQIHALDNVQLKYKGGALRPRVLDLQCGGALDVRMPDPQKFASRLEQLHMRASCFGQDLYTVLQCMAPEPEVQRGPSVVPRGSAIWDIRCPPCSDERMADLLRCSCGACMACLRREGKLAL